MLPIVGVTVVAGPPVGVTHLRLRPGVNLLYGANGAGKSRILAAVGDVISSYGEGFKDRSSTDLCVRAVYDEGGIHLHAPFDRLTSDSRLYRLLAEAVGLKPSAVQEPWSVFLSDLDPEDVEAENDRLWREIDRSAVRSALVKSAFDRASWAKPTLGQCEQLVDDGQWMFTASGIFVSAPIDGGPLDWSATAFDWNATIDEWKAELAGSTSEGWANHRRPQWWFGALGAGVHGRLVPIPEVLGFDGPDWLALPVAPIGTIPTLHFDPYDFEEGAPPPALLELVALGQEYERGDNLEDPPLLWTLPTRRRSDDVESYQWLRRRAIVRSFEFRGMTLWPVTEVEGEFTDVFDLAVAELEGLANGYFGEFFESPPRLVIEAKLTEPFPSQEASIRWMAIAPAGGRIPVAALGSAHRRYARFAVQRAVRSGRWSVRDDRSEESLVLIDEPERALHRSGERRVLSNLSGLGTYVLSGSHSPILLGDRSVNVLHVSQSSKGFVRVASYAEGMKTNPSDSPASTAEALGIELSDLLALVKVFVLVEGAHDKVVIPAMCPELESAIDVRFFAMNGTRDLVDLAKCKFLIEMTDAQILVIADNTRIGFLSEVIKSTDRRPSAEQRRQYLLSIQRDRASKEEKSLIDLLIAAVDADCMHRVHPFGLRRRDVAEYLPIKMMLKDADFASWQEFDQAFLADQGRTHHKVGDGKKKKTFAKKFGGEYTVPGLRKVVSRLTKEWDSTGGVLTNRDPEFTRIVERVNELRMSGREPK